MARKTERVFIRNARLSFPALAEKRAVMKGDAKEKYMATFILDRDNPCVLQIHEATVRLAQAAFGDKAKQVMANTDKLPLKNGDRKELAGYAGKVYIKATSDYRPDLVDANPRHILTDPKEIADRFQAGYRVNGFIDLFAYDFNGMKGISASLVSVQFAGYDEVFTGGSKPGAEAYPDCSDQVAQSSDMGNAPSGADLSFNPEDFDSAYLYG